MIMFLIVGYLAGICALTVAIANRRLDRLEDKEKMDGTRQE